MAEPKPVRLFFALWPDDPVREQLGARAGVLRLDGKARHVPDYNLHLTLHFVGNVSIKVMDCMRQRARRISGQRFELEIDRWGWFGGPQVGWLGPAATPAALAELHLALGDGLADCGFLAEQRAFNPHVTVARNLSRDPALPNFVPLRWEVREFALIESVAVDGGVKYRPVETWPLR